MVAPTLYLSTDAGAPVLSGTAGTMIAVLDACLVNGYGAKPAAGWTKEYSGTNLAAYRMGTGGSANRMYLRVDDNANVSPTFGRIRGFDAMTDIDTGTEPFPTVGQQADPGLWFNKSTTIDATARPWTILATPTCFYFFSQSSVTTFTDGSSGTGAMFFGEYVKYMASFSHHVALVGHASGNVSTGCMFATLPSPDAATALLAHYLCRAHGGASGAAGFSKLTNMPVRGSNSYPNLIGYSGPGLGSPDPVTGKAYASRVRILSPTWALAGHFPGFWASHSQAKLGSHSDTIAGTGALAGRTLFCAEIGGSSLNGGNTNATGRGLFDLTDFD